MEDSPVTVSGLKICEKDKNDENILDKTSDNKQLLYQYQQYKNQQQHYQLLKQQQQYQQQQYQLQQLQQKQQEILLKSGGQVKQTQNSFQHDTINANKNLVIENNNSNKTCNSKRPWNSDEDNLLRRLIQEHGGPNYVKCWKKLTRHFKDRSE